MKARGDARAYDRYLAAMDASMRQKVAVLAAHVLGRGKVADMGMGSGTGSEALASLYPELHVVGVDLDPVMVERARARFDRDNLSFVVGDIAEPVFEPGSLDGIFDSSVLHHVQLRRLRLRCRPPRDPRPGRAASRGRDVGRPRLRGARRRRAGVVVPARR